MCAIYTSSAQERLTPVAYSPWTVGFVVLSRHKTTDLQSNEGCAFNRGLGRVFLVELSFEVTGMKLSVGCFRRTIMITALAWALAISATAASLADRRDFTVHNQTSYQIKRLYVSPHNAENWEEDVLGQDVLQAGHSVTIHFSGAENTCYYDIKAVYEDGDKSIKMNLDLCRITDFNFVSQPAAADDDWFF